GNSAVAAVSRLKERGARDIRLVCLLAAPEGIAALARAHPEVRVFTAAVDTRLNDHGYIVPGLGDAGDRTSGTQRRTLPMTFSVTGGYSSKVSEYVAGRPEYPAALLSDLPLAD